jgi:hypothetical protein
MELIAHRPLSGTNIRGGKYRADPGDRFDVAPKVGLKLMQRGLASVPPPPRTPAAPLPMPQMVPVAEGLESIQALIRKQTRPENPPPTAKAIHDYEDKALRPAENKRQRGRPAQRTRCKVCGQTCPSAAAAKRHC